MEVVRIFGDTEKLYFKGIGNGLGGTPLSSPVVFSIDEGRGELWVSTQSESLLSSSPHIYRKADSLDGRLEVPHRLSSNCADCELEKPELTLLNCQGIAVSVVDLEIDHV